MSMSDLREYKCPACGGAIEFDSKSQKMKCPYCDTEFELETLKELGVMGKKIITLFNKQDAPGACVLRDFKSDYTLKVSAKTGEGLADLNDLLEKLLAEEQIYVERLFPYQEAGKIQLIREYGQLISEEYTEEGIAVKARVPKEIYARVV